MKDACQLDQVRVSLHCSRFLYFTVPRWVSPYSTGFDGLEHCAAGFGSLWARTRKKLKWDCIEAGFCIHVFILPDRSFDEDSNQCRLVHITSEDEEIEHNLGEVSQYQASCNSFRTLRRVSDFERRLL